MTAPQCGLATKAKVERIIDGDSIEVSVTRKFTIRLVYQNEENKIFDAPEKNTQEGQEAIEFLMSLLTEKLPIVSNTGHQAGEECYLKEVILFIPSNNPAKLMDITSFERILGEVWVDGQNVGQLMLDNGHAKLV